MRTVDAPEPTVNARASFICDNLTPDTVGMAYRAASFLHTAIAAWRADNQTHATTKELQSHGCWTSAATRRRKDGFCWHYARIMPDMRGSAETRNPVRAAGPMTATGVRHLIVAPFRARCSVRCNGAGRYREQCRTAGD
jgi:hypothetical protein